MHLRAARKFALIASLLAGSAACNSSDKAPSPKGSQAFQPNSQRLGDPYQGNSALTGGRGVSNSQPLFVAIGGWNSCVSHSTIPGQPNPWGMNLNKGFSKLMKHVGAQDNREPNFVIACHSPDTSVVRYVLSTDPGTLRVQPHLLMHQEISQFAKRTNSPLVILGHSYGGAFAMHTALDIPPDIAIQQLITIDGISPINCPPAAMAKLILTRFGQITGLGESDSNPSLGCQQSPRDFSPMQKQAIRAKVGWWQNYYQSDLLSILRADAIPEACNTPVKHEDIKSYINGHIAMGMYDKLWRDITNRISSPFLTGCLSQPI